MSKVIKIEVDGENHNQQILDDLNQVENEVLSTANENEIIVLSHLIKDIKYIDYAISAGCTASWFTNDLKIFYKGILFFFNKHNILFTKSLFMNRIEVLASKGELKNPILSQYEDFYNDLLNREEEFEFFVVKLNEIKDAYAKNKIKEAITNYANSDDDNLEKNLNDLTKKLDKYKDDIYLKSTDKIKILKPDYSDDFFDEESDAVYLSGIYDIDNLLKGVAKKNTLLLQGASGKGKSSFARFLCRAANKMNNASILYCHFEEDSNDNLRKIILSDLYQSEGSSIPFWKIKHDKLTQAEKESLLNQYKDFCEEQKRYNKTLDFVRFSGNQTVKDIIKYINNADVKYDMVVIDHLSLINTENFGALDTHIKYGKMAQMLSNNAVDNNYALILLQQSNRNSETQKGHTYSNNTLEGSSQPYQYADKSVGVWISEDSNQMEIWVHKNRTGTTGIVTVAYQKDTYTLTNDVIDIVPETEVKKASEQKQKTKKKIKIEEEESMNSILESINMTGVI